MTREIKFRAWDKNRKVMVYGISVGHRDGKQLIQTHWDDSADREGPCPYCKTDKIEFEVMEYTGLKDKNGKEIYEGDIVTSDNKAGGVVSFEIPELKFWVGEHEIYRMANPRVIGNIYEDPELLKITNKTPNT